ncbi:MAG: DUF2341 domain-containing protein, partial [Planctomycetota bacterium]|nr:DUF2341 domain-containing protein [Planctomycetota bacterium]
MQVVAPQGRRNYSAGQQGEDLRFSSGTGTPLVYQIEEWDAANGTASIWVRIPTIKGNARQEIKLHWGKADAPSESNGAAVFNADNGYASVLHMSEALKDELGAVTPVDAGTTLAAGIIGEGRHFVPGKGVNCGNHITTYPFSDSPFTSEAWFRAEPAAAGSMILYWGRYATRFNGKTGDGNEVAIGIDSPPRLGWGSDGPGGARAGTALRMKQWTHVAATYAEGTSRIYVNGTPAGSNYHKAAMSLVNDICMNIGGWRGGSYSFAGDIDEVRVSRVARSAEWMRLQYENQNPMQTLVGPVVQKGTEFAVSPTEISLLEGKKIAVGAKAGGAQKVYWILMGDGAERVVAADRYSYTLEAGRVVADKAFVLQFRAVYANEIKTIEIPVGIKEDIPEPVVALQAPAAWNGRETIEVILVISNLAAMKAKGACELKTTWAVSGGAVIKEGGLDKLILKRSQCSGTITIKAAVNNGGADSIATALIQVTEPKQDAWVQRTPGKDEKPEDNQFYARDDKNEGTLFYNGSLDQAADAVYLKVYADDKVFKTESQKLAADKTYAFTVKLKPGLVRYKVEFGTKAGETETVLRTVNNPVCGDAYIIQGQSNAEATGPNNGPAVDPPTPFNDWIRSYGNSHNGSVKGGWGNAIRTRIWGKPDYGLCQIGAWGMVLANNLVEKYRIPICIMNGAVGGTRIDQHQRNEANHNAPATIYGLLLTRIEGARLTHGIRGVLWHQGENNQGSASPTGDYDWKSYQQYFVDLAAAWKQDYPNIQHYYIWQIWPSGCNMGGTNAGDMLLEVQRTLPALFSNMRIMSTLGIVSKSSGRGLCHFDLEGYAQLAQLMSPLVEQDSYGFVPAREMTVPNLRRAWFTSAAKNEIALDFGQPMAWKDGCDAWFNLDDSKAPFSAGKAVGNVITVQLKVSTEAKTISYLSGKNWDGRPDKLV